MQERYFDRELSWLSFNGRVLQEAADDRVPLIERLRFLAIFSSNLDEFFRVRVAAIRTLLRAPHAERLKFEPRRLLIDIHETVDRQQREFGAIFRRLLARLREEGIFLHTGGNCPEAGLEFARRYFAEDVAPHIHPIVLEHFAEPPFLKNGGLYLVVPLWPRQRKDPLVAMVPHHGLVEVPSEHVARFVQVHRDAAHRHIMFLDDIVRINLPQIFPSYDTAEAYAVKMTRDAELYIEDEFSGNLVETIRRALSKRDTGLPTRFLYDQRMPYPIAKHLSKRLALEDEDLIQGGYYHNFSDFFAFPDFERGDLLYSPLPPRAHRRMSRDVSVLECIEQADHLVHFPYQSFDTIVRFVREAARHPSVSRLFATLYRAAPDSRIVAALMDAAAAGKDVTAFVEVKARFDERPNLEWASRMERAGIHVIYSHPGLKVHCKLLLAEAGETAYAYLGTGNLNEKTARLYCDHGLLTSDPRITGDVRAVFHLIEAPSSEQEFSHLFVAPHAMRKRFKALVQREIEHARGGRAAKLTLKMNSLEDRGMIRLLYRASQEGVDVRLIVRGICCLLPGVPGLSERIEVTSIVGRFLEHARIYAFHNGGDTEVYLASADWMKRNLKHRIEVAWPVLDPRLRRELMDLVELQASDNTRARIIDAHQVNAYVERGSEAPVDAQLDTYRYLSDALTDSRHPRGT